MRPANFAGPSNPVRSDETLINFPHRFDIADDVKRFGVSLWQDHTRAGSQETFSLHYFAAWIYLPMLAFLVLSPAAANTLLHISIPLYSGLTMYLLTSLLSRNRWARAFGAIAFALNGYSIVWLSSFVLPVIVATLPLGIYLGMRFLQEGRRRDGVLFSVTLGAILYFAYPPGVIIYVVITAIFLLCDFFADSFKRPRLLPLAGFGLLGLGLGMAALLPTIADLGHFAGKAYHNPPDPIPLRFLKGFVFPNFAGNPVAGDWTTIGNYCEFIAYNGSLPFMLAGVGALVAFRRRRAAPLAVAAVIAGLLSFVLAYAGPVVRVLNRLPIFYDLNPARWTIGIDFSLAVLSVIALDALLKPSRHRSHLIALAGGIGLFILAALGAVAIRHGELLRIDHFRARDAELRLGLIVLGALALACLALLPRAATVATAALVTILALDLVTFGVNFNPAIPGTEFYPVTPAIGFLEQNAGPYRVLPTGGTYYADNFNVYGLDVITGYDHFRDEGYISLLGDNLSADERQLWSRSGFITITQQPHLDEPVFNQLAVKYAYFPASPDAQTIASWQHWRTVYSGPDGAVLENLSVLSKQFLVDTGGTPVPIDHVAARSDRDHFSAVGAGTLVWSKPWSGDWHVQVDGRAVATRAYDGYFLSARIPSGRHAISLSYEPSIYLIGSLLSLVSALALAALLLLQLERVSRSRLRVSGRWRPLARPSHPEDSQSAPSSHSSESPGP